MFESIEIRKVSNGFVVSLTTEDETKEFVFDTPRKAIKFVKEYVDSKPTAEKPGQKTLSPIEIDSILEYVATTKYAARDRLMVLLSLDAGMPVREIAELTIADVWNEDGTVKTTVFWPRKNDHISKLSSNMRKEVFSYLIGIDRSDMTAPLFGTQKREAFNANTLCQHFFWIYKKAGIEASSHSGRKTYLKRLENV